jgi:hypothetical protein
VAASRRISSRDGRASIISFAIGGPVPFSLGGGILCGVVVFIIGYGFRRLVLDRHKAAPGKPRGIGRAPLRAQRGSAAPRVWSIRRLMVADGYYRVSSVGHHD